MVSSALSDVHHTAKAAATQLKDAKRSKSSDSGVGSAQLAYASAVASDAVAITGEGGYGADCATGLLSRYRLLRSLGHGGSASELAAAAAVSGGSGSASTSSGSHHPQPPYSDEQLARWGIKASLVVTGLRDQLSALLTDALASSASSSNSSSASPSPVRNGLHVALVDCVLRLQNLLRHIRSSIVPPPGQVRSDLTDPDLASLTTALFAGEKDRRASSGGAAAPVVELGPASDESALRAIYRAYRPPHSRENESAAAQFGLDLDYRSLALASSAYGHDAQAMMHAELWWTDACGGQPAPLNGPSPAPSSLAAAAPDGRHLKSGDSPSMVLARIFESIDDPDALLGVTGVSGLQSVQLSAQGCDPLIGSSDLEVLRRLAVHQGDWEAALSLADAQASSAGGSACSSSAALLQPMAVLGLHTSAAAIRERFQPATPPSTLASISQPAELSLRLLSGPRAQSQLCSRLLSAQTAAVADDARSLAFSLLQTGVMPVLPPLVEGSFSEELHQSHLRWMIQHHQGGYRHHHNLQHHHHHQHQAGGDAASALPLLLLRRPPSPAGASAASAASGLPLRRAFLVAELLSQAKDARRAGRFANCATALFQLTSIVDGAAAGVSVASPSSSSSAFSFSAVAPRSSSPPPAEVDAGVEVAAILTEQAKLAWAQGDVDAALTFIVRAAMRHIAALIALLQQYASQRSTSAAAPISPSSLWLRATVSATHLCDVLTLHGTWLSTSGLDASGSLAGLVHGNKINYSLEGIDGDMTAENPFLVPIPEAPPLQPPPPTKGSKKGGQSSSSSSAKQPAFDPVAATVNSALGTLSLIGARLLHLTAPQLTSLGLTSAASVSPSALYRSTTVLSQATLVTSPHGHHMPSVSSQSALASLTSPGLASRNARAYFQAAEALAAALPPAPASAIATAALTSSSSSSSQPMPTAAPVTSVTTESSTYVRRCLQSRAYLAIADYAFKAGQALRGYQQSPEYATVKQQRLERVQLLARMKDLQRQASAKMKAGDSAGALAMLEGLDLQQLSIHVTELANSVEEDNHAASRMARTLQTHSETAVHTYAAYLRTRPASTAAALPSSAASPSSAAVSGLQDSTSELRVAFRLVSLLYDSGTAANAGMVNLLGAELAAIPATKFLDAMPQICSRLGPYPGPIGTQQVPPPSDRAAPERSVLEQLSTSFRSAAQWTVGGITECLLQRMLLCCPRKVVLQLLAMEKGNRDVAKKYEETDKMAAASRLLKRGSCAGPALRGIIESTRLLTDAYVSIASVEVNLKQIDRRTTPRLPFLHRKIDRLGCAPAPSSSSGAGAGAGSSTLPSELLGHGEALEWLFESRSISSSSFSAAAASVQASLLAQMPIVTAYHTDTLPYGCGEDYRLGEQGVSTGSYAYNPAGYTLPVHLTSLGTHFAVSASGLAVPKFVDAEGSDGRVYRQIIKKVGVNTLEDIRQDAVMQQLFGTINKFLRADPQSRTRRLRIRTYQVVPTTFMTGVLERVESCISFGQYLGEAHARHHPDEIPVAEARATLQAAVKEVRAQLDAKQGYQPLASDPRVLALQSVFRRFTPVFHHFFTDVFPQPDRWAAAKAAYARSTATNSMVGYVAGIGDRHVQNILLDTVTGEAVHIDFGIAFEQARLLPTPEQVFFRLTRDVVAGLGVTGTKGTFSLCCGHTMRVLREQEDVIVTVLSVVLGDPLYRWKVSPDKARRLQRAREDKYGDHSTDETAAVGGTSGDNTDARTARGRSESVARGGGGGGGGGDDAASAAHSAVKAGSGSGGGDRGRRDRDVSVARVFGPSASGGAGGSGGRPPSPYDGNAEAATGADDNAAAAAAASAPEETDVSAFRAIQRARQKLLGQEFSESTGVSLSVPAHVTRIILDHQSMLKLALMFDGWQAYF